MNTLPSSDFDDVTDGLLVAGALSSPVSLGSVARLESIDIIQPIGKGGMGSVFLGVDPGTGNRIAVKLLRPDLAARVEFQRRFHQEYVLLTRFDHPNIVSVKEAIIDDKRCALLMPYLEKGSLRQLLEREGPLDQKEILRIAIPIADALQCVHDEFVLHCDVNANNVLFDGENRPYLADFGLSWCYLSVGFEDQRLLLQGTAPYLSPQLAAGEPDKRCDVYAFGVLLYHMAAGVPPYSGESKETILDRIRQTPPRCVRELRSDLDERLVVVIEKAMARDISDRAASPKELRDQLLEIEANTESGVVTDVVSNSVEFRNVFPRWCVGVSFLGFLIGFLVWLLGPSPSGLKSPMLVIFDSPDVARWDEAEFLEWDGLPGKEIYVPTIQGPKVFHRSGELLSEWDIRGVTTNRYLRHSPIDITGDGRDELSIAWSDRENTYLVFADQRLEIVSQLSVRSSPYDERNSPLTTDLMSVGTLSAGSAVTKGFGLVAFSGTGYSDVTRTPWRRGLHLFNPRTREQVWEVLMGPPPNTIAKLDLDGDGLLDFVVGTSIVSNGNIGPDGSSDGVAYVYGISGLGKVLWRVPLTQAVTGAVLLVRGAQEFRAKREIYVVVARGEWGFEEDENGEKTRVVKLSSDGEILDEFQSEVPLRSAIAVDLDQDSEPEILTLDRAGGLTLLKDLRPQKILYLSEPREDWSSRWDSVVSEFMEVGHYFGSDLVQIPIVFSEKRFQGTPNRNDATENPSVLELSASRVAIFDSSLDRILDRKLEHAPGQPKDSLQVEGVDIDEDGTLELVWFSDKVRVISLDGL